MGKMAGDLPNFTTRTKNCYVTNDHGWSDQSEIQPKVRMEDAEDFRDELRDSSQAGGGDSSLKSDTIGCGLVIRLRPIIELDAASCHFAVQNRKRLSCEVCRF